jgi:transcriptional regulator with XRE-family HTH domain
MEEKVPNRKLRNARIGNNWTQQDVADRIGTTPLSVGRWERGEAFPSAYYRQQLCDLFGMSSEELGFTEEEH